MGRGIDTQKEREAVEYRPGLEYIPPVVYIEAETGAGKRTEYEMPYELTRVSEIKITDSFEAIKDILDRLNGLIEELEQELKGTSIKVDKDEEPEIYQALQEVSPDQNKITFDKYREIKFKPEPTYQENAVNNYFEEKNMELEGELKVEILSVAYDVFSKIKETEEFIISELLEKEGDFDLEQAREDEIERLNKWLEYDLERQKLEEKYYELSKEDASDEDFDQWRKEYREVQDELRELSVYGPKGEIGRTIHDRAQKMDKVLTEWEDLTHNTLADEFDGYIYCLIKNFLEDQSTGFDISRTIDRLKTFQSLIEFAFGDRVNSIKSVKKQLENLKTLPQRTVLQAGAAAIGTLKNQAGRVIADFVQKNAEGSECSAFRELGQDMIDVAMALEVQYNEFLDDYYKANDLESNYYKEHNKYLRNNKKKQGIFQILDQLIKTLETIGKWSEQDSLDQWVSKFIKDNNLNVRYNRDIGAIERFNIDEYF